MELKAISIDPTVLIITTSLLIQIIVLFLLSYAYLQKKKLRFRQHGLIMTSALVLHLTMIFYVMIPSFVLTVVPKYILVTPQDLASIVGLIHGILGPTAVVLGIWLVASWRFRKDLKGCFGRKKLMLTTFTFWIASLVFGIGLYAIFIWPLLSA